MIDLRETHKLISHEKEFDVKDSISILHLLFLDLHLIMKRTPMPS